MAQCLFCAHELPADAERCPMCEREVLQEVMKSATVSASSVPIDHQVDTPVNDAVEGVYELSEMDVETDVQGKLDTDWQRTAVYTLEQAARCPYCREPIRTVRVVKMSRTQVTFTSTLPRGGRAIVCPECDRILTVELATFG